MALAGTRRKGPWLRRCPLNFRVALRLSFGPPLRQLDSGAAWIAEAKAANRRRQENAGKLEEMGVSGAQGESARRLPDALGCAQRIVKLLRQGP